MQVALHGPGRDVGEGVIAEDHQAHGVPLSQHQIGQRRGEATGVAKLRHRAPLLKPHRATGVQQQIALQVGLFLVPLDVEAVRFTQGLPVQVAQGIALHVRAVLGEFNGKAVVGTAVQAGDESLDDESCYQVEASEARDDLRLEKSIGGIVRRHRRHFPAVGRRA